jgi:hypothetical protein
MNQGTQGYSLTKKTEGRKSRDTVSLIATEVTKVIRGNVEAEPTSQNEFSTLTLTNSESI